MKIEQLGDLLVIDIPHRLDAVGVAAVEAPFAEAIAQHQGYVLVDMAKVDFVGSLALRMLLTHLKTVQDQGSDLWLCTLQPAVADIVQRVRFDTLFQIYPDRAAALQAHTDVIEQS